MRRPTPGADWPDSWRTALAFDELELWGSTADLGHTWAYRRRFDTTVAQVLEHLAPGSTVLDVAAAQGTFSLRLAELGYDVTWNDLRGELAGYVQLKHEEGEVHYRAGNAFELDDLPLFDAVLATEVIEHVAHPDQLLVQLRALCRPGGLVFLSTPNGDYFRSKLPTFSQIADPTALEAAQFRPDADGHLFLLTNDELAEMAVASGFTVLDLSNVTSPLLAGDLHLRALHSRRTARPIHAVDQAFHRLPPWASRHLLRATTLVLRG